MKSIDLKAIMVKCNMSKKVMASHLFPENKFPQLALNRILSGGAEMTESQITRLSAATGIPFENLYDVSQWKVESNENDIMKFSYLNYKAELNTKTWITKIFDNDSLFHESIIHTGSIELSKYLKLLDSIIATHVREINRIPKGDF